MPRPTDPATWDSNDTNTVAVTGSHQSDGWAVDEVPTSSEMNEWQKLVGEWIAALTAELDILESRSADRSISGHEFVATGGSPTKDANGVWTMTSGDEITAPFELTVGATITAFKVFLQQNASDVFAKLTVKLKKRTAATPGGGVTSDAISTDLAAYGLGSANWIISDAHTADVTIAADARYWVVITATSTGNVGFDGITKVGVTP